MKYTPHYTSMNATPEYPDGINAYHVDVIAAFRSELAQNPGMLWKYRRNAA